MIGAVTFDFWGTLYREGADRRRRMELREQYALDFLAAQGRQVNASQLGYAFEVLFREMDHLWRIQHAGVKAEELGFRLARAAGALLEPPAAVRLGELMSCVVREAPPTPAEGALDILRHLHGRVRLGLICDTGITLGADLYAVMEADGVAQLLDHFTFSDQTGTTKPELRQFTHTLLRLNCPPEQAVHVGDTEQSDIAGAKAAGMRAIRILHDGHDPTTAADASARSLPGVLTTLRRWDERLE